MALDVGSRLGHYEVIAIIGEGGMGQIYQATDTKLNRQVALKSAPEAFPPDPDRLAGFRREADVLADLNHPRIAGNYGLKEQNRVKALVLKLGLVEGLTETERIARGPFSVETLTTAKKIAEAFLQTQTNTKGLHKNRIVSRASPRPRASAITGNLAVFLRTNLPHRWSQ